MPTATQANTVAETARDLAFAGVRFGWLCALPVAALGLGSGLVPSGQLAFAAGGALAALASPALLLPLQRRAMARGAHGTASALLFQATLQAGFVVKLAVVGGGSLALSLAEVKFDSIAVFALAFLAVAMVSQVATACHLARSLTRRAAARNTSSPGSTPTAMAAGGHPSSS